MQLDLGDEHEGPEEFVGIVVGFDAGKKIIQVLFDIDEDTTDCFECDVESMPYASVDIKWMQPSGRTPILVREPPIASTHASSTTALSLAEAHRANLESADNSLLFYATQMDDLLSEHGVDVPVSGELVEFEKLRVKPLLNESVGCFVKLASEGEGDDAEDDICGFIVGFDQKKKILQLRFADFSLSSPRKPVPKGVTTYSGASTVLNLVVGAGDDDEESVDELPYSTQGMLWYRLRAE